MEAQWNTLVEKSKNGTFLFDRRFMDYHADRFTDCSVVFLDDKRKTIVGALPANWCSSEQTVYSHQGLTYGGLILLPSCTTTDVMQMFDLACTHYRHQLGAKTIVYKPVPYIYNRYPADEPLYALFRHDARLTARSISTTISLDAPLPMQQLRHRQVNKALRHQLCVTAATSTEDLQQFWDALNTSLLQHHGVRPVHSMHEMQLLMARFPNHIQLYVTKSPDAKLLAGVWILHCGPVAHLQYITTTEEGRQCGALDLLIATLTEKLRVSYQTSEMSQPFQHRYLDFGISTERQGHYLNEGLIFQKEGFGGRGVCYDTYELNI